MDKIEDEAKGVEEAVVEDEVEEKEESVDADVGTETVQAAMFKAWLLRTTDIP